MESSELGIDQDLDAGPGVRTRYRLLTAKDYRGPSGFRVGQLGQLSGSESSCRTSWQCRCVVISHMKRLSTDTNPRRVIYTSHFESAELVNRRPQEERIRGSSDFLLTTENRCSNNVNYE